MKIAIITLTEQGLKIARKIEKGFEPIPSIYMFNKATEKTSFVESSIFTCSITYFSESLQQLVNRLFKQYDGLIFIMAIGIVVRMIAPYIKDKYTDPAV